MLLSASLLGSDHMALGKLSPFWHMALLCSSLCLPLPFLSFFLFFESLTEETSRRVWTWLKEESRQGRAKTYKAKTSILEEKARLVLAQWACVCVWHLLCTYFTVLVCEQVGLWWDTEQCLTRSDSRVTVGGSAPHASSPSSSFSPLLPNTAKQPYTYPPTVSTHSYCPILINASKVQRSVCCVNYIVDFESLLIIIIFHHDYLVQRTRMFVCLFVFFQKRPRPRLDCTIC